MAYGVSGEHIWLKGDAIGGLADNDPVATWPDQSGGSRDATQSDPPARPFFHSNVVGSLGAVRFDGTDARLLFGDVVSSLTAAEVFLAVKIDTDPPAAGAQSGLWTFGSTSDSSHFPFTDGVVYDGFGSTTRQVVGNPGPALTSWHIYNVTTTSSEWTARLDNSQLFTTATNTVGFTAAPALGFGGVAQLDGDIGELLVFPAGLSSGDRLTVYTALAARWMPTGGLGPGQHVTMHSP